MDFNWMLPPEAFEWIESNIPEGSRILEFGSGHGSERLARRYDVWSVEHDEEWLGITPVNYVHAPIVDNEASSAVGEIGWYDPSALQESRPESVALIIVDGPPGSIGRTGLIAHIDLLPATEQFLIDDVDREAEESLLAALATYTDAEVMDTYSSALCRTDGSPRQFAVLKLKR